MLTITKNLFGIFNKEQIRYCVIRDSAYLKEGLNGTADIDILVHPEDMDEAQQILPGTGFKKFLEPGAVLDSHKEDWIGFDDSTGRIMSIRLYQDIVIEGKNREVFVFCWRDIALRSRVRFEGTNVYVVEPHLETVMLYIQLAQRVEMGKNDQLSWRALCGTASLCGRIRKEKMVALCSEIFWGNGILISQLIMDMVIREKAFTINPPTDKELVSLRGKIEREPKAVFYIVGSAEDGRPGTLSFMKKGKGKVTSKEGISICFIGVDGSGKTTISDDVEKWLAERFACKKFYMGNGDQLHSISKNLDVQLSRVSKKTQQAVRGRETEAVALSVTDTGIVENVAKSNETGIIEFARYPLSVTQAYGYMRFAYHSLKIVEMAESYRRKGGIAIFDRYPQVQFEGIYDGPKISAKYQSYLDHDIFMHMAEREADILKRASNHAPSIVFRLLLTPEVSLARKPDHDYENIRRKAEITEKLVFKHSKDYKIDATQPYDKELLQVKRIIWESLTSLS